MQLLEHALRPLSHPPVRADVVHAVTNGLGALPALAAKWRYGTPMIVTEHGIYMREQYLHCAARRSAGRSRTLYLRFLRRLCTLGYHEAEVITPGNVYNKRWENELGADLSRVRTVYNGVDPADFPVADRASPRSRRSRGWAGSTRSRTWRRCCARSPWCTGRCREARLRMFGSPPQGREAYLERCQALAAELGLAERRPSRAGCRRSGTPTPPARSSCSAASPRASPTP